MSEQCTKHRINGKDSVDVRQLVCPDCDNERLNDRIEQLEAKLARSDRKEIEAVYRKLGELEATIKRVKALATKDMNDVVQMRHLVNALEEKGDE